MENDNCWLTKPSAEGFKKYKIIGASVVLQTVEEEMSGLDPNTNETFLLGKIDNLPASAVGGLAIDAMGNEGYAIKDLGDQVIVAAKTDAGILYGAFHLQRLLKLGESLKGIDLLESPKNPVRMLNHWDNMDETDFMGSVERGYAGKSIFFENKDFIKDKSRLVEYARLISSVGINAISINNVNVHKLESQLITERFLPDVAEIAGIFRRYAIKIFLSINFASTMDIGGLQTADPLDEGVRLWWKEKMAEVYAAIPDFGGVVVKADSEGRPGPFTYGRTHADGANMLAEALKPFGGTVFWRCFVYNCQQDWRDRNTDRARAAYDHFMPLDGEFRDNVVLQIKNGPIDFQVREPISPLLGGMKDTNQILEFQVTQEYTGHSHDVCFLVPQWKEYLDWDTHSKGDGSTVAKIANGSLNNRQIGGIVAVANVGRDSNWTGHKLAQANLYGYGRLIWDTDLSPEQIADEWVKLTFGLEPAVVGNVKEILKGSWPTYEKYTAPLGVGFMVQPHLHYGVNVDGYEYSPWGTYHFADRHGIGVDRTKSTGTGYSAQYFEKNHEMFEDPTKTPENMLLFFHHLPYSFKLRSGKKLIQHIYDTHFEGVEEVKAFQQKWDELEGKIDKASFHNVKERLNRQLNNATQWRDQVNTYFYRKSGIEDEQRRTIY
ncbi:MAG: hypothetical protein FWF59_15265 [Turicibacter sp.]|nr:hypothetical protein [Turicibacter sp.]